jgi:hypothetical protein
MVMTMPTVAARLVMVFIVYDVWMCGIYARSLLYGIALKEEAPCG